MDRQVMINLYKTRNVGIDNIENKRKDDQLKLRLERQNRRTALFNSRRSISNEDETAVIQTDNIPKTNPLCHPNARKLALQKYKREKDLIKQTLNQKKKPPFVVGIPHHGSSPVLREINIQEIRNVPKVISSKTQQEVRHQRVTRANSKLEQQNVLKEKDLGLKFPIRTFPFNERQSVFTFHINKVAGMKKLTSPHTPTVLKRSAQKNVKREKTTKEEKTNARSTRQAFNNVLRTKKKLLVSSTDSAKPLAAPLPSSEALGNISEEHVQQITIPSCSSSFPSELCGNEVAAGLLDNHVTKQEITSNAETICQRDRVDKESDRLLSLAEEWEATAVREDIPQDVVDEIDSVVGQTRLLAKDKFNQFRGLINQFEDQQGSQNMTLEDLNGFWDMVYLQVEHLIKRYSKLEKLKIDNWKEPKPATPIKKKKRGTLNRKPNKVASTVQRHHTEPTPSTSAELELITEQQCSQILRLSLRSSTPRRYSPSPYIAMRLSNIGRSISKPSPTVGPSSLSSHETKVEPPESTLTPRSILKRDSEEQTSKKIVNFNASLVEVEEVAVGCSLRRSVRLVGKPSTPLVKLCSTCQSPECVSSSCSKQMKKSRKTRRSENNAYEGLPAEQHLENTSIESSFPGNSHSETNVEPSTTSKKFVLRPSKLFLTDSTKKSPVPTKKRHTLRGGKENSSLSTDNMEPSGLVRRSTRLASAKKVTFNSSAEDKSSLKLPSTPYGKKGWKRESLSDSFSD